LLADAARIVSDLHEYRDALPRLAKRIVKSIGDWCVIDEILDGGRLVEVGAAHVDSSLDASVRALERRCELDVRRDVGPACVARTGTAQLFEHVTDGHWLADVLGARQTAMLAELGGRACMFVPLTARARTLGVMTLVATRPYRRFVLDDLALAEEIGCRVGTAIDNAHLFEDAERGRIERENLLAIVSHDLRSPLASVVASASLLDESRADESVRVHKYAKTILRSAKRMDRLIGDLTDFAQLQSGTLRVEQQPLDAASLIRECLDAHQPMAQEKEIRLEAQIGDSKPVYGDRDRVQQILTNLVGNAIKFTSEGGLVTVRMSCTNGEALFGVADNGPGIPESELPRVWGRFWQGKKTAHTGVGLGLFIAKGLVEAHGGRIWVESKVNVGTTFFFVLPTCSREVGRGGADIASA
jgi:signal transduction histidine kinase